MDEARSVHGIGIRLTTERWLHIAEEHSEMAGYYHEVIETVESPQAVVKGAAGELLALREIEKGQWLVAVYKEASGNDGFIITAFLTRRIRQLERRKRIWPK
jgi:hypothetical protein